MKAMAYGRYLRRRQAKDELELGYLWSLGEEEKLAQYILDRKGQRLDFSELARLLPGRSKETIAVRCRDDGERVLEVMEALGWHDDAEAEAGFETGDEGEGGAEDGHEVMTKSGVLLVLPEAANPIPMSIGDDVTVFEIDRLCASSARPRPRPPSPMIPMRIGEDVSIFEIEDMIGRRSSL